MREMPSVARVLVLPSRYGVRLDTAHIIQNSYTVVARGVADLYL